MFSRKFSMFGSDDFHEKRKKGVKFSAIPVIFFSDATQTCPWGFVCAVRGTHHFYSLHRKLKSSLSRKITPFFFPFCTRKIFHAKWLIKGLHGEWEQFSSLSWILVVAQAHPKDAFVQLPWKRKLCFFFSRKESPTC